MGNNEILVGIHIDPHKEVNRVIERYESILDFNAIPHIRLDSSKSDFWEKIKGLSLFIFHLYGTERQIKMAHTIIPIVEETLRIPCYPNVLMGWLYDDKIREYYFLKQYSLPVIPTSTYWNKQEALQSLNNLKLPVVFKLKSGASDENVVLIESVSYGKRLINKMFSGGILSGRIPGLGSLKWKEMLSRERLRRLGGKIKRKLRGEEVNLFKQHHRDYVLLQKFLPNNKFDTRIAIIGNRAFGDVRYIRENDFRASGSWRYSCDPANVDLRCIKIAFEISKRFSFPTMMYDFLFDENNQPLISEISYAQPDWRFWMYPGYWDEKMNWHEGHNWMQYLVLMDILKMPDIKQPELELDVDLRYLPKERL